MANFVFRSLRRLCLSSLLQPSSPNRLFVREIPRHLNPNSPPCGHPIPFIPSKPCWVLRNFSHASVNLVISQGKVKFQTHQIDPPKKDKWKTKKRLKLQRKKEKHKRKSANKRDPRHLGVKGKKKKHKFANAEERIKYKLDKAKIKEALLIDRLKRYEVPKLQGPVIKPEDLTGEERFYMKKMAQKGSNYVPIGRRGIFGGVILNMHMHWKKHETVKVICKSCKPGQVHEYAQEIARLSGGTPIQIIGDDTIIFYRGKNYVQPKVMSPIDTLSKKRALEKSKYEQSLESVRRFIAIAEKELELYYRHVALYGDPNSRNPSLISDNQGKAFEKQKKIGTAENETPDSTLDHSFLGRSDTETDSLDDLSDIEDDLEDNYESVSDLDDEDEDMSDSVFDSWEQRKRGDDEDEDMSDSVFDSWEQRKRGEPFRYVRKLKHNVE